MIWIDVLGDSFYAENTLLISVVSAGVGTTQYHLVNFEWVKCNSSHSIVFTLSFSRSFSPSPFTITNHNNTSIVPLPSHQSLPILSSRINMSSTVLNFKVILLVYFGLSSQFIIYYSLNLPFKFKYLSFHAARITILQINLKWGDMK